MVLMTPLRPKMEIPTPVATNGIVAVSGGGDCFIELKDVQRVIVTGNTMIE
jgi:hypothetical protein